MQISGLQNPPMLSLGYKSSKCKRSHPRRHYVTPRALVVSQRHRLPNPTAPLAQLAYKSVAFVRTAGGCVAPCLQNLRFCTQITVLLRNTAGCYATPQVATQPKVSLSDLAAANHRFATLRLQKQSFCIPKMSLFGSRSNFVCLQNRRFCVRANRRFASEAVQANRSRYANFSVAFAANPRCCVATSRVC